MKHCDHCGELFRPKFQNLKLCFTCYRKREQALAEYDHLQRELADLRAERDILIDALTTRPEPTSIAVPRDLLPKLIRLCHPDKHANAAAANEVTRWLLEQRRAAP
jgi:hypothetical protein